MRSNKILHSLRFKIFIAVGVLLAAFITIFFTIITITLPKMLTQAEEKYISEQALSAAHSFDIATGELKRMAGDMGYWGDAALFAEGGNPGFIEENWPNTSPEDVYAANIIVIKDIEGNDRYAQFYDFINDEYEEMPEGFTDYLRRFSDAVKAKYGDGPVPGIEDGEGGIIFYGGVPYLIVAAPIADVDNGAKLSGTVIMGRALTNEYFRDLTYYNTMDFELLAGNQSDEFAKRLTDDDQVETLIPLEDIDGGEAALIISDSRAVYTGGQAGAAGMITLLSIAIIAFIAILYWLIVKFVLKPVEHLTGEIKSANITSRVDLDGYAENTEFESLKTSINSMLQGLNESNISVNILYNILNSMDANLYVTDPETDEILFINDEMKRHFGIEGEAVGKICWEVLQSDMTERCGFCPVYELMKNPDATVTWEEHNTLTGRYYQNTDRLIEWSDGRPVHVQHSVDITDIKVAGQALKKQLDQQVFMSDISASFISTEDMTTLIGRALEMTGEFLNAGKIIIAALTGDNTMAFKYGWRNEKTEAAELQERRMPFGPGNVFYDSFVTEQKTYIACGDTAKNSEFAFLAGMGVTGFLSVPVLVDGVFWGIINVDNYKGAQHWETSDVSLLKLISSVISSVIKRDGMERSLIEAKNQAEQASKAKGDFLSRMSHEMRTPMNAIIGMTRIALASDDIEKKEYCLGKIQEASNHLLGVINDILDMSKIEANKFELSYVDFVFEKMLIKVTNVISFRVDEKKQNFVVDVDKNIPYSIISDEQRLAQVITNLLTNAVKFTPEMGNIRLDARLVAEEKNYVGLEIRVKDDGIGISEENQKRLFQSFEQADGSISRQYGGTGLGLAISKNIVEMLGGGIWVESEPEKGSVFAFTLRAEKGKLERQAERRVAELSKLHILAVDDSVEVRDYFKSISGTLGFKCDVAEDGYSALELVKGRADNPYDVIFVDWRMPGMDGVELAGKIKKISGEKAVIIMISATEWSVIEDDARAAGVTRYIQKPLFPSVIVDSINESLGAAASNPMQKGSDTSDEDGIFEGYRVLLAEDYLVNQEILKSLLEHTGIAIDTAENGEAALSMFETDEGAYDLIFMDIHMPKMDGYEATRRLRALDTGKARSIPIVAMTANVFREDIEKCLAAGMNDHVGKPVDMEELIAKMRKYLLGES